MKASEITIGKKVKYHPFIGDSGYEIGTITSGVFSIGGTECCMIDIRSGCVAIESLEAM